MMNGIKKIEVRKNKALASAIQKLIDEYGYADIYVYCSKDKDKLFYRNSVKEYAIANSNWKLINFVKVYDVADYPTRNLNGKVVFKFRCYKADDYVNGRKWSWKVGAPMWGACNDHEYILKDACLTDDELRNYADDLSFSAIHISDLEIFDRPKDISEFKHYVKPKRTEDDIAFEKKMKCKTFYVSKLIPLTKAPQNFAYIDIDKGEQL